MPPRCSAVPPPFPGWILTQRGGGRGPPAAQSPSGASSAAGGFPPGSAAPHLHIAGLCGCLCGGEVVIFYAGIQSGLDVRDCQV